MLARKVCAAAAVVLSLAATAPVAGAAKAPHKPSKGKTTPTTLPPFSGTWHWTVASVQGEAKATWTVPNPGQGPTGAEEGETFHQGFVEGTGSLTLGTLDGKLSGAGFMRSEDLEVVNTDLVRDGGQEHVCPPVTTRASGNLSFGVRGPQVQVTWQMPFPTGIIPCSSEGPGTYDEVEKEGELSKWFPWSDFTLCTVEIFFYGHAYVKPRVENGSSGDLSYQVRVVMDRSDVVACPVD